MRVRVRSLRVMAMALALPVAGLANCAPVGDSGTRQAGADGGDRWSHQDWPTGHYRVVEGWP